MAIKIALLAVGTIAGVALAGTCIGSIGGPVGTILGGAIGTLTGVAFAVIWNKESTDKEILAKVTDGFNKVYKE